MESKVLHIGMSALPWVRLIYNIQAGQSGPSCRSNLALATHTCGMIYSPQDPVHNILLVLTATPDIVCFIDKESGVYGFYSI